MTRKQQKSAAQAPAQELQDEQLEDAQGGIIAILIGLKDPNKPGGTSGIKDGTSN